MKHLKIRILAYLIVFFGTSYAHAQTHYKLYCFYTPEFEKMYEEYFLPNIQDPFEIIAKKYPQECPSSTYKSKGWNKTMLKKLEMLLEAIDENWNNQIFVYSDIDVIFLQPTMEALLFHLGDRDFVAQEGWPRKQLCAGFLVLRGNKKTRQLISQAHYLLKNDLVSDDQVAIQTALDSFSETIQWDFLPSKQFPNGRRILIDDKLYVPGSKISLDPSMILFHANCTIGLENKFLFLNEVLTKYNRRNH